MRKKKSRVKKQIATYIESSMTYTLDKEIRGLNPTLQMLKTIFQKKNVRSQIATWIESSIWKNNLLDYSSLNNFVGLQMQNDTFI